MPVLSVNPRRELEIHHFPILVYALVPLAALVLQAWLPRLVTPRFAWFDLPLVVTIYFSLSRRSPAQGAVMGCVLGIFEDALTHRAIGVNGVAKTVAGYLAASVGVRIDVENFTIRLLITFVLSMVSSVLYLFVYQAVLGLTIDWNWLFELMKAAGNSTIAIVLFPTLDHFKIRD
jgi:rod shape-determining protein MreD